MLGLRSRRRLSLKVNASVNAFSWKIPVRMTWPVTVASTSFSRVAKMSILAISGFWCSCLARNSTASRVR